MRCAIALGVLGLTACAHTPSDRPLTGPVDEPAGVVAADGSASQSTAPASATAAPAPAPVVVAVPGAPGTTPGTAMPAAEPGPEVDLFDRIRKGFTLDEVNQATVEQEARWYANNPEYLERAFGRAELYLYHIVGEIEARNMPIELALLPIVESAFQPFAYSKARAAGLWQFIPDTGTRFGLKQNWWYDGRRDVVESTRAALDYLQYLHDEFQGDWLLAVAGYNCGENAVARAIRKNRAAGLPTDFWSLRLPRETRAYVPKLLAMKRLVADPDEFGLAFSSIGNRAYFARVETYGQIDLRLAAEIAGVTHDEVYELNPAFHRWATDPSGPHFLLLPKDAADTFRNNVVQLTPDERVRVKRYAVQAGDSVASVAQQFNTNPQVIRQLNDLPSGVLTVGTELRVPSTTVELPAKVMLAAARVDGRERRAARPHVHVVRRGDSLWRIAKRNGMNVKTLARMNGMKPNQPLRAGQRLRLGKASAESSYTASTARSGKNRKVTYTVRRGDTLTRIASVFQVSVSQLVSWNGISAKSAIRPGQKLTIRVPKRG